MTIVYDLPDRAEEIAIDQHEQGAPLEVVLATAGRIATAEELRNQAGEFRFLARTGEHGPNSAGVQMLVSCAAKLEARAVELDPDGAR